MDRDSVTSSMAKAPRTVAPIPSHLDAAVQAAGSLAGEDRLEGERMDLGERRTETDPGWAKPAYQERSRQQRDQLLNVLRHGLNQQHPRVRDRRAAVLTREGERRRGEARRQAPSGPVHLQPDAVQIIELHVRPRDERRRISEA